MKLLELCPIKGKTLKPLKNLASYIIGRLIMHVCSFLSIIQSSWCESWVGTRNQLTGTFGTGPVTNGKTLVTFSMPKCQILYAVHDNTLTVTMMSDWGQDIVSQSSQCGTWQNRAVCKKSPLFYATSTYMLRFSFKAHHFKATFTPGVHITPY